MKLQTAIWFLPICMLLVSCKDMIQYNPMEIRLSEEERNLNYKNILKINALPEKDTFKFVLIGDSQRFYDEMDLFVNAINQRNDLSFVLLAGDITDFGTNREFKWINRSLSKLNIPYLGIIGNHDMLANGRRTFHEMYGEEDFTFSYSGVKFICLNTNSREVGFDGTVPDLPWLQQELSNLHAYKNAFVVSHVPPFDADFDPQMANSFAAAIAGSNKVKLSLHGHIHSYSLTEPYNDGIQYLVVSSMQKRRYVVVTVANDTYFTEQVYY